MPPAQRLLVKTLSDFRCAGNTTRYPDRTFSIDAMRRNRSVRDTGLSCLVSLLFVGAPALAQPADRYTTPAARARSIFPA
jgi:hypothetical protein